MNTKAESVLDQLLEGNRRFAGSRLFHPHQDALRRAECVLGQKPVAAVFGCADSRVPPEILFDCGIGDLFIVRSAGTFIDNGAVASLEYAVDHLHVPLVIVLGHTSCGAVTAAMKGVTAPDSLGKLLETIREDCDSGSEASLSANEIDEVTKKYTVHVVEKLLSVSSVMKAAVGSNSCTVAAANYSLDNGLVEIL